MQPARLPKAAEPWANMLQQQVAEHESLLKALEPEKCSACGEGTTFLAVADGLMFRVCNHCGSEISGKFESQWNINNKTRRDVAAAAAALNGIATQGT